MPGHWLREKLPNYHQSHVPFETSSVGSILARSLFRFSNFLGCWDDAALPTSPTFAVFRRDDPSTVLDDYDNDDGFE